MKQLEPVDDKVKLEVDDIIDRLNNGEDITFTVPTSTQNSFIRYCSEWVIVV
jgi:hypothetical protein